MLNAELRRPKVGLTLAAAAFAVCLALLIGPPSSASASTSAYCNNYTLGGSGVCYGAARNLYQTYGWGDQHSVCVWATLLGGESEVPVGGGGFKACSGGPGSGVYSPAYPSNTLVVPAIKNNAAGSNLVHGVALTH